MNFRINFLLATLVYALFISTNVFAQSHNNADHDHHQITVVSPFTDKGNTRSFHCLLRGHVDRVICPHSNPDKRLKTSISMDCDGKNSGSIPNITLSGGEIAQANVTLQCNYFSGEKLFLIKIPALQFFIDSLDHPPIVLL